MNSTFKSSGIATALFAVLSACTDIGIAVRESSTQIDTNSAELTKFLDEAYARDLHESPEALTAQGLKDRYAELDDRSEGAEAEQLERQRRSVAEMKARFRPADLNDEAKLSYDIWELELRRAETRWRWRRHEYVFTRGATASLPNFLMSRHSVASKSDMDAYIARLSLIDDALDQKLVRAKLAAEDGVHMPMFCYDEALGDIKRIMTGAPFDSGQDSPLYADAKVKIRALFDMGLITKAEADVYSSHVADTMRLELKPAYDRVTAFLSQDKSNGQKPNKQGATALPDGARFYDSTLYLATTTSMSAQEIHALGIKEVARIRKEMEDIKDKIGYAGSLEQFFSFMRTEKRFYLSNNDAGAAEYVRLAEQYLSEMKSKLPKYFGVVPKSELVVRRVESYREQAGGAQFYMAGTPDGSRPGIFYAQLSDMNAMPTYQLEAIAYHEGLPGHHLQISIKQELKGLPKIRTQGGYGAYGEGWGLYAESLAKEMGQYSDPYNDFGRLSTEMWRAIRLVVDTGIHAKGWTQQQAENYFTANSPQALQSVKSEIERYIIAPGLAASYKIGMISFQQLRDEARTALGNKFDYATFHKVVLESGALPIPVLEAKVRRWIRREAARPPS